VRGRHNHDKRRMAWHFEPYEYLRGIVHGGMHDKAVCLSRLDCFSPVLRVRALRVCAVEFVSHKKEADYTLVSSVHSTTPNGEG